MNADDYNIYVGNAEILRVYKGDTLVWEAVDPPAASNLDASDIEEDTTGTWSADLVGTSGGELAWRWQSDETLISDWIAYTGAGTFDTWTITETFDAEQSGLTFDLVWRSATGITTEVLGSVTRDVAAAASGSPWQSQDIGTVGVAGSYSESGGTHTVQANGADWWGTEDRGHIVYQQVEGDFTLTVRLATAGGSDAWRRGIVMARETLDADARYVAMAWAPSARAKLWRSTAGGTTSSSNTGSATVPHWLRVVRSGDTISAYYSANGDSWIEASSATTLSGLPTTIYAAFAYCAHDDQAAETATFDNVELI